MEYLLVLFVALQCLVTVNACGRINFTVDPIPVYKGDRLTFSCFTNDKAEVIVSDFGNNHASCDQSQQSTAKGIFGTDSVSCPRGNGSLVRTFAYATTDMGRKNYTCTSIVSVRGHLNTSSCNRTLYVLDIPEISLTPKDVTLNDTQNVTILCSIKSTEVKANITLTLSVMSNARHLKTNASVNSVEMTFSVSRDFHEAAVRCEALQESRVEAKNTTLRVNYIFSKRSIVNYHSINGSYTFNCSEQVESRPGVQYQWFTANSTQAIETLSSYTCKAPQRCNVSVTCVATNNVTRAQSNVTFIYQNSPTEHGSDDNSGNSTVNKLDLEHVIIAVSVCTVGALIIVSIVVLLVWKWRICKRKRKQRSKMPCCQQDDDLISMKENELYEAMPMMTAAAISGGAESSAQRELIDPLSLGHCESKGQSTSSIYMNQHDIQSQHAIESLVLASATVAGNLKHKVGSKAYLVLLSEQSSTLRDVQEKIEATVSTKNSLKQVAFLLRQAKKGLVLSLADNVNIDGNTVSSNQRLRDFLKLFVERYMNKSSAELRLDLLNYPDAGTSNAKKMAKTLTSLLGIPVYLSNDMYGVNTAVDDKRCVADVYFHRRHIENPVIYTDVDLSKDSRRFPAHPPENVVYSEIVRPALRPPLSAGQ